MARKATVVSILILVIITVSVAVAACGGSDSSQQAAKQSLSTDLQQLKTDLGQLLNPSTYDSIDSFQQAWKDIQAQYDKTATSAKQVKDAQWTDVTTAFNNMKDAITGISSSQSLQQNITSVLSAGQQFLAALDALNKSVFPNQ